jgi:hypothetical protein
LNTFLSHHFTDAHNTQDILQQLHPQVHIELLFVAFTYARAHPRTMVIMCSDTLVTLLAVLSPKRLFQMADSTVLELNEGQNIHIIIFFFNNFHRPLFR